MLVFTLELRGRIISLSKWHRGLLWPAAAKPLLHKNWQGKLSEGNCTDIFRLSKSGMKINGFESRLVRKQDGKGVKATLGLIPVSNSVSF